ncbi:hypothetical protein ACHAWF_012717 [Thalassiosira exigua]
MYYTRVCSLRRRRRAVAASLLVAASSATLLFGDDPLPLLRSLRGESTCYGRHLLGSFEEDHFLRELDSDAVRRAASSAALPPAEPPEVLEPKATPEIAPYTLRDAVAEDSVFSHTFCILLYDPETDGFVAYVPKEHFKNATSLKKLWNSATNLSVMLRRTFPLVLMFRSAFRDSSLHPTMIPMPMPCLHLGCFEEWSRSRRACAGFHLTSDGVSRGELAFREELGLTWDDLIDVCDRLGALSPRPRFRPARRPVLFRRRTRICLPGGSRSGRAAVRIQQVAKIIWLWFFQCPWLRAHVCAYINPRILGTKDQHRTPTSCSHVNLIFLVSVEPQVVWRGTDFGYIPSLRRPRLIRPLGNGLEKNSRTVQDRAREIARQEARRDGSAARELREVGAPLEGSRAHGDPFRFTILVDAVVYIAAFARYPATHPSRRPNWKPRNEGPSPGRT